jgi:hypothetical protein
MSFISMKLGLHYLQNMKIYEINNIGEVEFYFIS